MNDSIITICADRRTRVGWGIVAAFSCVIAVASILLRYQTVFLLWLGITIFCVFFLARSLLWKLEISKEAVRYRNLWGRVRSFPLQDVAWKLEYRLREFQLGLFRRSDRKKITHACWSWQNADAIMKLHHFGAYSNDEKEYLSLLKSARPKEGEFVSKAQLTKHWLRPYWRAEELDEWLAAQEAAGWRLERVGFFRRFVFREAKPRDVAYYMTFKFPKEFRMFDVRYWITRTMKADVVDAYTMASYWMECCRITSPLTPEQKYELFYQKNNYLRHLSRMGMLMWAIFFVPTIIALVFASVDPSSVRTFDYVLVFGVRIVSGLGLLYYFYGWLFLRRRRRRFMQGESDR